MSGKVEEEEEVRRREGGSRGEEVDGLVVFVEGGKARRGGSMVEKRRGKVLSNQMLTWCFPMIPYTGSYAAAAGCPEEETTDPGEAHRDTEGWTFYNLIHIVIHLLTHYYYISM